LRSNQKIFLLTALGILSQISSIIMGVILVRVYNQSDYGTFRQALFITDTVGYICTFALPASLLFLIPGEPAGFQKGIFHQTQALLTGFGFIGSACLFFLAGPLSVSFHNPDLKGILRFFCLYPLFHVAIQHIPAWFMGLDRYKTSAWVQTLTTLTRFIVVAVPAAMGVALIPLLAILIAFMGLQALVQWLWCLYDKRGDRSTWKPEFLRRQLDYSIPLGLSGIVWYVSKEIDKYLVATFVTPSEYALYSVGALEIPLFNALSVAISSVLVPKIVQHLRDGERDEIPGLWREVIRRSIFVFIPCAAILFAVSIPMIGFLYTKEYIAAVIIFQVYLLKIPMRIFNPNLILQGIGKTKVLLIFTATFLISNTVLTYLCLKVLQVGLWGPALASVVSSLLTSMLSMIVTQHLLKVKFLQVFPMVYFLKVSALSIVAAAAGWYTHHWIDTYWLQGLAAGTLFTVVFLGPALYFRLTTWEELGNYAPFLKKKGA